MGTPYTRFGRNIPWVEPYERFKAWQECHRLVLETYRMTEAFPPSERFGLTSQARRAAVSAAANIAEGSAKRGRNEFRRYLDISRGSITELSYLLRCARDLGYASLEDWRKLDDVKQRTGYLVWRLYSRLGK